MDQDMYQYVVSDYFATGEGITYCFLVTRAYPRSEDYVKPSWFDDDGIWHYESELRNTAKERALREFQEHHGSWYVIGATTVSREEFLSDKYRSFIPEYVRNIVQAEPSRQPGNFIWYNSIHVNYS